MKRNKCTWQIGTDGIYVTSCGHAYTEPLARLDCETCPYCGRALDFQAVAEICEYTPTDKNPAVRATECGRLVGRLGENPRYCQYCKKRIHLKKHKSQL